jgi:hypothetical protein
MKVLQSGGRSSLLILPPPLLSLRCNGLHQTAKSLLVRCNWLQADAGSASMLDRARERFGSNSGAVGGAFRGQA